MPNLNDIKHAKLKDFISKYPLFINLPEPEKEDYLNKILAMSYADQDNTYKFLLKENDKAKQRILESFLEKLTALGKALTSVQTKHEENKEETEEQQKMAILLDQINK